MARSQIAFQLSRSRRGLPGTYAAPAGDGGRCMEVGASSGGEPVCDAQLSKPFRMGTFLQAIQAIEDYLKPRDAICVSCLPGIERLVPGYLACRSEDGSRSRRPRNHSRAGHHLRGSGTAYGFAAISQIGRSLESAARRQAADEVRRQIAALADYLARVRVGGSITALCPSLEASPRPSPLVFRSQTKVSCWMSVWLNVRLIEYLSRLRGERNCVEPSEGSVSLSLLFRP